MKFLHLGFLVLFLLCASVNARPSVDEDYGDNLKDSAEAIQNDEEDYDSDDNPNGHDDDDDPDAEPEIHTKPLSIIAKVGDTLYLPCNRTNDEAHVTMWRRNEDQLYQEKIALHGKKDVYSLTKNGTLVITNIQEEYEGEYTCAIMTTVPATIKVTHTVQVARKPVITEVSAENKVLSAGETLRLTCNADGFPEPKITWSKDGVQVGGHTNILEITNVDHSNHGIYQCLAHNMAGVSHNFTTIQVNHKPVIRLERISSGVRQANDPVHIELHCIVHGFPEPKVSWFKDNKFLDANDNINIKKDGQTHKLIISNAGTLDLGKYKCSAKNSEGEVEKHIVIEERPSIAKFDNKKIINDRQHGTKVTWKVESFYPLTSYNIHYKPKKETSWKKLENLTDIDAPAGTSFTISYFFTDIEAGQYDVKVQAANEVGVADFSKPYTFEIKKHHHNHHIHHEQQVTYDHKDQPVEPFVDPKHKDLQEEIETVEVNTHTNIIPAVVYNEPEDIPESFVETQTLDNQSETVDTQTQIPTEETPEPITVEVIDTKIDAPAADASETKRVEIDTRTAESASKSPADFVPSIWLLCIAVITLLCRK